jgi:beta-N-acetylhexosaminidase
VAQEPDHVYRRRRLAAVGAAGAIVIAAVLVLRGLGDDSEPGPPPEDPLADVPLDRLVGQRLMVRMSDEATPELVAAARRGEIGGVILFPPVGVVPADLSRQVERLQRAAEQGGNPPLLVATDQEGGDVKRFPDGPPQRSPAELGADGDVTAAAAAGEETAAYLEQFGINVDLAPVLDVAVSDSFMAERAFGDDPALVADVGVAFGDGLAQGGVAATAKHFPGLGLATINTDLAPSSVDASADELRPGLEPFDAAIASGVDLVMMSNATYPELDPDAPAGLSSRIVGEELRDGLGFDGVVITDDLEAGAISASFTPPDAAVEAARAGADVLLFAKGAEPGPLAEALLGAAQRGHLDRESLDASYVRITELKNELAGP